MALEKIVWIFLTTLITSTTVFAAPNTSNRCSRSFWTGAQEVAQRLSENNFRTNRNFLSYEEMATAHGIPKLSDFLAALRVGDIWLDAGAGNATAMREVLHHPSAFGVRDIQFVALAYAKPINRKLDQELSDNAERFQYIEGGYIEDLVRNRTSELYPLRNRVNFLTEIIGPMGYSQNPTKILRSYADVLKVGGNALIYFAETPNKFFWTDARGVKHRLTLRELSALIPVMTGGRLQVKGARMARSINNAPEFGATVFWLEKVATRSRGAIDPLKLESFEDEAPPEREYTVLAPEGFRIDPEDLRQTDISREDEPGYPLNIPSGF